MAATWFNRFNKAWSSSGLRDDPTDAQANAGWAYIGQAPPTVEQFNSTHNWWDQKDNWLYNQIAQVIIAGGMTPSDVDTTQLLKAIKAQQRFRLSAPLTLFVDSTNGNDANTGAQGSPFKTINRALRFIHDDIDQGGQQVTIQLAPGTYDPVAIDAPNLGLVVVNGDRLNQRGYLIKNTNGPAVLASSGAHIWLQGVSLEASGGVGAYIGTGIMAVLASIITFMDVSFGPCSYVHIWATSSGTVGMVSSGLSYSIYGAAVSHFQASAGGVVTIATSQVTIQNNPMFASAFAVSQTNGIGQVWNMIFNGTAQGARYLCASNGVVNSLNAGINYLPGTSAGYVETGGQYV